MPGRLAVLVSAMRTSATRLPAIAMCAVTLPVSVVRALFFALPSDHDYMRGGAPWWITAGAATLGALAALVMTSRVARRNLRGPVLAAALISCALLLWSAAGLVFDLLRVAAVLGIPGLPPFVDWFGMASRAASLAAAVTLSLATVFFQSQTIAGHGLRRYSPWFGYVAALLSIPYPALKIYWSLGGTVGWNGGSTREPAVGETAMLVMLVVLSLALTQNWGRSISRPFLLIAGYSAAVPLISMGALVAFGTVAQLLGIVNGPIRFRWSEWIVYYTYVDWLLLGLALGAATWAYQRRTFVGRALTS
jgi:hypothetical protein